MKRKPPAQKPLRDTVWLPTKIQAAAEVEAHGLAGVRVLPATKGVVLVASDARIVAVVHEERGHVSRASTIPRAVLPGTAVERLAPLTLSGTQWRKPIGEGRFVISEENPGCYPNIDTVKVFPETLSERVCVKLDTALLGKLVTALNNGDTGVHLFINRDDVNAAVIVVGEHGMGAIMPMEQDRAQHEREYLSTKQTAFKAASAARKSSPKPKRKKR